jgi:polyisoprenoid-binding protein YceI
MRLATFCVLACSVLARDSRSEAIPAFAIAREGSAIQFSVKASVALEGTFDKWDATLTFASTDASTGVLDVKVQADSVDTGSWVKDSKLKSEDFFDVEHNPLITFLSTRLVQIGPDAFDVQGNFTIRGVTKPETLRLTVSGKGTGSGEIKGTMAFDRREFGMDSSIPFIKVADRVEVSVALKVKRVSGPPLVFRPFVGD